MNDLPTGRSSENLPEENFAALFEESLIASAKLEGTVVEGTVIAIENDAAVIDVGLKAEGRVPIREFAAPGESPQIGVGDYRVRSGGESHVARDSSCDCDPRHTWLAPGVPWHVIHQ